MHDSGMQEASSTAEVNSLTFWAATMSSLTTAQGKNGYIDSWVSAIQPRDWRACCTIDPPSKARGQNRFDAEQKRKSSTWNYKIYAVDRIFVVCSTVEHDLRICSIVERGFHCLLSYG